MRTHIVAAIAALFFGLCLGFSARVLMEPTVLNLEVQCSRPTELPAIAEEK